MIDRLREAVLWIASGANMALFWLNGQEPGTLALCFCFANFALHARNGRKRNG